MDQKQDVIKNLSHFVKHQRRYIFLILFTIFLVQTLSNFVSDKPLIIGSESYFHIYSAQQGAHYNPLILLLSIIPESLTFLVPFLIMIGIFVTIFKIADKLNISKRTTFFFTFFLAMTPGFFFGLITISSYSLFFLLILLGFLMLLQDKGKLRNLSLLPFLTATLFDLFSSLLILVLLLIYALVIRKKKEKLLGTIASLVVVISIFNKLIFKIPIFLGPFHQQQTLLDLVSDLGGLSGISLFILFLAVVGLIVTWKKENFYFLYLLLPTVIVGYIFSTSIIFYLSITAIFFATVSFTKIFEKNWNLVSLKKFTLILLILGVTFSTIAYMDRISSYGPLQEDKEVLLWMEENTAKKAIVLSTPENTYMIKHFAKREPVSVFDKKGYKEKSLLSERIFSSIYVKDLFPLLEENKVNLIYITKEMKNNLPEDQGFLFLLKNERFKLIHSAGDSEVWVFE